MTRDSSRIWLPLLLGATLLVYLVGLGNALVFDDSYLTSGLFDEYASPGLRARLLSYGSFVWLHAIAGDGWWKQRLANLLVHGAVVLALWGLYREILRAIEPPPEEASKARYEDSPALGIALAFFALNPVAVYAVAYLIQRSILLATFFVVLGLWSFAAGLRRGKPLIASLFVPCYALALLSKEAAVAAPLACVPLYILVARPTPARLARFCAAGAVLVLAAAVALWQRYGGIIGTPFDEYSRLYLAQLAVLAPSAAQHAYGLSVMNQAWLFFRYGLDWLLPWSGWLSIELRPPFPIAWLSFPQTLGVPAYAATLAAGFYLVARYRDWRALAGVSILLPALLYVTEFSTVWLQDPFVLYRSYLWAIGVPGIVFIIFHGPSARVMLGLGIAIGALLAWQGVDRVLSLESPVTAWTDAIEKLPDDPRAVGRWFPYLNRGSAYVDAEQFDLALLDFEASSRLGDQGMGDFNMGAVLSARGHAAQALAAFDRAQREGYNLYNLPFQRGLALLALGRRAEALDAFQAAERLSPPSRTREILLLQLGRTALGLGRWKEALAALEPLVALQPRNSEARYLLAMSYLTGGQPSRALPILDALLMEHPSRAAYYGRALANYGLKRKHEALSDIESALRGGPDNTNLKQWRERILAMP